MTENEREDVKRLVKRRGQAGWIGGTGFVMVNKNVLTNDSLHIFGMPISNVFVIIGSVFLLLALLQEHRVRKQLPKLVGESS